MIKLLQVVEGGGWGGTKEQTYLISKELAKRGLEVHMAISFGYQLMLEKLKDYPIRFHFFENHRGLPRLNPMNYYRLRRVLKEEKFHIVIANSPHALDFLRIALAFVGDRPKVIAYKRTGRSSGLFSKLLKYAFADRIVVVDRRTFERLKGEGFFPEKLRHIPSGIDLQRFKPLGRERALAKREELGIDQDKKVFINVANWNPEHKGQPLLIEAFARLRCPKCLLVLVGIGTDIEAPAYARRYGLENNLLALGFREDIPELLNMSDFFVFSSYFEGIAGAVLQGMACGKVVISTLAGGIGDYLRDGENGFGVQVGDLEGFVEKLKLALQLNKEEYERLSRRAIETAREYSIERTVEGYLRLFSELLGGTSNPQSIP
ncbi:MAG: glycosyltransferase family 4 protein [Aquificaceae bacterium]|nr:glycosyltransferase family 4 protein [Aquificaceae bacterium]